MLTFVDFETVGLNGDVVEACAVNESGKVILYQGKGNINFEDFMDAVMNDGGVIIFWHNFMPLYLSHYMPNIFNKMKGRFLVFTDFYAIFDGVKQPRYSIQEITKNLTGRNHVGNARQDALDLAECYRRMQ